MEKQTVKADVLCIGGGIAGLMAAIRASELGAKVVVADKSNTIHSGRAGAGNDHFLCYLPEVHGADIDAFIQEAILDTQMGEHLRKSKNTLATYLSSTAGIVKLWESWGIPMKYQGNYEFAGHTIPGAPLCHLRYEGKRQKRVLTEQALKRGVTIINRVMVLDLAHDERVTGAVGIGTRQDRTVEFVAKSVVLGTGKVGRLYPELGLGWFSKSCWPPSISGDGRVMAYRAGAELADVEMPRLHAGPKYFCRAGQGSWMGVLRDSQGQAIGPFVTRPERKYGDVTTEISKGIFDRYAAEGKGPVYMDCRGMSEDDYQYMMHWFPHEGLGAFVDHLQNEGIDLRRDPVEFATYDMGCSGKIWVDNDVETSLSGLYAAGDEVGSNISNAAVFGWIAGERAAHYAETADFRDAGETKDGAEKGRLFQAMRERPTGPDYKEVNVALQQIMIDYAGSVRSEASLMAGLSHLRRLRKKAFETVMARNSHELASCVEVFNLLDLGELVFITAAERKETRGRHIRPDYPVTNPLLNKSLIVKKLNGKLSIAWR